MSECLLCHEDLAERPSVLVDFYGEIAEVCDDCVAKADEPDMDMPERDREGDPAFNGSFAA